MSTDLRIRRAAAIIMWHLHHGHALSEAKAKAWRREPDLTEDEMERAATLAFAGLDFADAAADAAATLERVILCYKCGGPVDYIDTAKYHCKECGEVRGRLTYVRRDGAPVITLRDVIKAAGQDPDAPDWSTEGEAE